MTTVAKGKRDGEAIGWEEKFLRPIKKLTGARKRLGLLAKVNEQGKDCSRPGLWNHNQFADLLNCMFYYLTHIFVDEMSEYSLGDQTNIGFRPPIY
jgi:hypothetical protein